MLWLSSIDDSTLHLRHELQRLGFSLRERGSGRCYAANLSRRVIESLTQLERLYLVEMAGLSEASHALLAPLAPTHEPPLPAGWHAATDVSGHTYFWDDAGGVQWSRPVSAIPDGVIDATRHPAPLADFMTAPQLPAPHGTAARAAAVPAITSPAAASAAAITTAAANASSAAASTATGGASAPRSLGPGGVPPTVTDAASATSAATSAAVLAAFSASATTTSSPAATSTASAAANPAAVPAAAAAPAAASEAAAAETSAAETAAVASRKQPRTPADLQRRKLQKQQRKKGAKPGPTAPPSTTAAAAAPHAATPPADVPPAATVPEPPTTTAAPPAVATPAAASPAASAVPNTVADPHTAAAPPANAAAATGAMATLWSASLRPPSTAPRNRRRCCALLAVTLSATHAPPSSVACSRSGRSARRHRRRRGRARKLQRRRSEPRVGARLRASPPLQPLRRPLAKAARGGVRATAPNRSAEATALRLHRLRHRRRLLLARAEARAEARARARARAAVQADTTDRHRLRCHNLPPAAVGRPRAPLGVIGVYFQSGPPVPRGARGRSSRQHAPTADVFLNTRRVLLVRPLPPSPPRLPWQPNVPRPRLCRMCRSHGSSGSCRRASRQRAVRHTTFHGARTGARDLTRAGGRSLKQRRWLPAHAAVRGGGTGRQLQVRLGDYPTGPGEACTRGRLAWPSGVAIPTHCRFGYLAAGLAGWLG